MKGDVVSGEWRVVVIVAGVMGRIGERGSVVAAWVSCYLEG